MKISVVTTLDKVTGNANITIVGCFHSRLIERNAIFLLQIS